MNQRLHLLRASLMSGEQGCVSFFNRVQKMGTQQEQFGYCVRLRRVSRLVRPAHEPARREVHPTCTKEPVMNPTPPATGSCGSCRREPIMAHLLHLHRTYRRTLGGVLGPIGAVLRAIASEHTRALRAATKAASPRQSLAQVRAMYVPSEPRQHGTEPGGSEARMTREAR